MTPQAILRAAAESIAPETWCQHWYRQPDGEGGCALWHIDQAGIGHDHARRTALEAVYAEVGQSGLADFNDNPSHDLYDVRELLERTAKKLEAR